MSTFDETLLSLKDFQPGISASQSLEKGGKEGFVAKYVNEQSELATSTITRKFKESAKKTNFPLRKQCSNLTKFKSRISLKKAEPGAMFKNSRVSGIVKIGDLSIKIPKDNPGTETIHQMEEFKSPHFGTQDLRQGNERIEPRPAELQVGDSPANLDHVIGSTSVKRSTDQRLTFERDDFQPHQNTLPRPKSSRFEVQLNPSSHSRQQGYRSGDVCQNNVDKYQHAEFVNEQPPVANAQENYEFDVDEFEAMFAPNADGVEMQIPQFFFPHRIY